MRKAVKKGECAADDFMVVSLSGGFRITPTPQAGVLAILDDLPAPDETVDHSFPEGIAELIDETPPGRWPEAPSRAAPGTKPPPRPLRRSSPRTARR